MKNINSILMDDAHSSNDEGSNRLWVILLILLAIIIGFWIGFFVNEYFYQVPVDQFDPTDPIDNEISEQVDDQFGEEEETEGGDEYIVFNEEYIYIGESVAFLSNNECIEDLNLSLIGIQGNVIAFQADDQILDPASRTAETAEKGVELLGRFDEPLCLPAQSSCQNVVYSYCFYMTHENDNHYLDYELVEDLESESLNQFL